MANIAEEPSVRDTYTSSLRRNRQGEGTNKIDLITLDSLSGCFLYEIMIAGKAGEAFSMGIRCEEKDKDLSELEIDVSSPSGENLDIEYQPRGRGIYKLYWYPEEAGEYLIVVKWLGVVPQPREIKVRVE